MFRLLHSTTRRTLTRKHTVHVQRAMPEPTLNYAVVPLCMRSRQLPATTGSNLVLKNIAWRNYSCTTDFNAMHASSSSGPASNNCQTPYAFQSVPPIVPIEWGFVGVLAASGALLLAAEEKKLSSRYSSYTKLAKEGNASAMFNLGVCYANGTGVDMNQLKAFEWYSKSAAKGNATAMYNLGVCYANGTGVDMNQLQAFEWYSKSADKGNAKAMHNLGVCYANNMNKTKAFEWYLKSAEQGNASAMFNLGFCYANGEGTDMSTLNALKWYSKGLFASLVVE